MRSIVTSKFIRIWFILFLLFKAGESLALAQDHWIDAIPEQNVGCVTGQGKIESIDFGIILRDNAKNAKATETGFPFLTKADPTGDASGSVDWEGCVILKGPAQSTNGFQQKTIPASPAAFKVCNGTDAKACSDSLVAWIKTKVPGFPSLTRVVPLFDYSDAKLQETKQSANSLITKTFQ